MVKKGFRPTRESNNGSLDYRSSVIPTTSKAPYPILLSATYNTSAQTKPPIVATLKLTYHKTSKNVKPKVKHFLCQNSKPVKNIRDLSLGEHVYCKRIIFSSRLHFFKNRRIGKLLFIVLVQKTNSHFPVSWVYALEKESGLEKCGQDLELYFYLKEALR